MKGLHKTGSISTEEIVQPRSDLEIKSVSNCGSCILEILSHGGSSWRTDRCRADELAKAFDDSPILFIFANYKLAQGCKDCCQSLSTLFEIPLFLWEETYVESNGYFGCEDGQTDMAGGHNTWLLFLMKHLLDLFGPGEKDYIWHRVNFFTRFAPPNKHAVICFDFPSSLKKQIPDLLNTGQMSFQDPYWFHSIVISEIVVMFDKSVWSIRDKIRSAELNRQSLPESQPQFHELHEVARHAIHSYETLNVSARIVENIIRQHNQYKVDAAELGQEALRAFKRIDKRLCFHGQMLNSFASRAWANKERLQNEITLTFSTVAQHDSKIAVQISQAAQSDNAAIKAISLLTLTFLPATFLCALFSTTFFSFTPGSHDQPAKWAVSPKLWIYWAIVMPLTIVTVTLWVFWQRKFPVYRSNE